MKVYCIKNSRNEYWCCQNHLTWWSAKQKDAYLFYSKEQAKKSIINKNEPGKDRVVSVMLNRKKNEVKIGTVFVNSYGVACLICDKVDLQDNSGFNQKIYIRTAGVDYNYWGTSEDFLQYLKSGQIKIVYVPN
jgi:hypothetical protein